MLPVTDRRIRFEMVLYATDFSRVAAAALPYAAGLARWFEGKLYLAHIATPGLYLLGPPGAISKALEREKAAAEVQMEQLMGRPELSRVPHEVLIASGDLPSRLAELASERDMDLIVVGASDISEVWRWLMGSTSTGVMRSAPCPVLTVGEKASAGLFRGFKRILCRADWSQESASALQCALSLAQEFEAALTVVHVLEEHMRGGAEVDSSRRRLEALIPAQARLWCRPEFSIRFGEQVEGILEAAREQDAELVVIGLGSENESGWTRTTAESVLAGANFPILTVGADGWARHLQRAA
jgi:nucleotide-binding universal stress UspA family protein